MNEDSGVPTAYGGDYLRLINRSHQLTMGGWDTPSPDSSLSSLPSDDVDNSTIDEEPPRSDTPAADIQSPPPPKKRRKINNLWEHASQTDSYVSSHAPDPESVTAPNSDDEISSDTSGEVPVSANGPNYEEEDGQKIQQTFCRWEGCPEGELGNMDNLVKHIHDIHIGSGKKHYSCEWDDCPRKGVTHPSAYALRAHMRSHTREKPFYCLLPECDRAFTRSDALAKHMRTVHETEANRAAEAASRAAEKQMNSVTTVNGQPSLKIKLVLSGRGGKRFGQAVANGLNGDTGSSAGGSPRAVPHPDDTEDEMDYRGAVAAYPPSPADPFSSEEAMMGTEELLQHLEREMVWAEEEKDRLAVMEADLAEKRLDEWRAKELLLDDLIELGMRDQVPIHPS